MLQKLWDAKVTRFLSVGLFNTLFDLTILNALVFFGHLPVLAANLVSASVSMTVSYFLNHHIVFRSKEDHSIVKFVHFFAVTGTGILAIQSLVIYSATHLLAHQNVVVGNLIHVLPLGNLSIRAFDLNVAKILAVLVAMTWNFTLYHLVIFKKPSEKFDDDILL